MTVIAGYTLTDAPHPTPDGGAHLIAGPLNNGATLLRVPDNLWQLQSQRVKAFDALSIDGLIAERLVLENDAPVALKATLPCPTDAVRYLYDINEPLAADALLSFTRSFFEPLVRLHSAGLIFGALTPDSVLSTPDGWTLTHPLLDTRSSLKNWQFPERFLPFIAPECRETGEFNAATDVFGAAATWLYAALPGADALALLGHDRTRHEWDVGLTSRGISKPVANALAGMLAKDPAKRTPAAFDALMRFHPFFDDPTLFSVRTLEPTDYKKMQRHERLVFNHPAHVWEIDESLGGDGYHASARDISLGGMMLEIETGGAPLPIGVRLTVVVEAVGKPSEPKKQDISSKGDGRHRFAGVIRWTSAFEDILRVGIEFTGEDHIKTAGNLIETIKTERIREELKSF
ncbi:MAG: PilZ domain-containing protein [Planctomycetota bacterium]